MKNIFLPVLALGAIVFAGASALHSSGGCCASASAAPAVAAQPASNSGGCCGSQSLSRQAVVAEAKKDDDCCSTGCGAEASIATSGDKELVSALHQLVAMIESGACYESCDSSAAARGIVLTALQPSSGETGCPFLDGCGDKGDSCAVATPTLAAAADCSECCDSDKKCSVAECAEECDAPCATKASAPIAAAE